MAKLAYVKKNISLNFEVINYPSSRYFLCIKLSHSTRAIRNWTNSEMINLLHDLCGVLANHTIIQSHRQILVNLSSLLWFMEYWANEILYHFDHKFSDCDMLMPLTKELVGIHISGIPCIQLSPLSVLLEHCFQEFCVTFYFSPDGCVKTEHIIKMYGKVIWVYTEEKGFCPNLVSMCTWKAYCNFDNKIIQNSTPDTLWQSWISQILKGKSMSLPNYFSLRFSQWSEKIFQQLPATEKTL